LLFLSLPRLPSTSTHKQEKEKKKEKEKENISTVKSR